MIIISLSTASFTPQASWCQPALWSSSWSFQRRSLPETLVAGWQLPNGDPSDGAGLSAVSPGYDAGPQPDHSHPRLRICQPLCSCCAVSENVLIFTQFCYIETDWFVTKSEWWTFYRHLHNNHIQSMGSRCFEGLQSLETLWVYCFFIYFLHFWMVAIIKHLFSFPILKKCKVAHFCCLNVSFMTIRCQKVSTIIYSDQISFKICSKHTKSNTTSEHKLTTLCPTLCMCNRDDC